MSSESNARRRRYLKATLKSAFLALCVATLIGAALQLKLSHRLMTAIVLTAVTVGAQVGVYFWGSFAKSVMKPKVSATTQAIALIVIGVMWHVLHAALLWWHAPYNDLKIERAVGMLVYYIAGLPPLVMGLNFAFRVFDQKFTPLFAVAVLTALSPAVVFLFVHLVR